MNSNNAESKVKREEKCREIHWILYLNSIFGGIQQWSIIQFCVTPTSGVGRIRKNFRPSTTRLHYEVSILAVSEMKEQTNHVYSLCNEDFLHFLENDLFNKYHILVCICDETFNFSFLLNDIMRELRLLVKVSSSIFFHLSSSLSLHSCETQPKQQYGEF